MDKDKKNIDQSLGMAIRLMEQPDDLGKEEIDHMIADKECMQACKDLVKCKKALEKAQISHQLNIDKEWEKFRIATRYRSRKRHWLISGTISIAASLLLIFWFSLSKEKMVPQTPIIVFQASEEPQQVILQTGNGKRIVLNSNTVPPSTETVLKEADSTKLVYAPHTNSSQVESHLLSTPRGKIFEIVLSDGTIVWLNAESKLEYPSQFVGKERKVRLQGEAYFQVAADKLHPFIIQTNDLQTRVLGTEFNIRNYSSHDSHITLIKGSVEVCNAKKGNYIKIKPKEDASLQADGSFILREVDVDSYVYWKEGLFYFDNMTLADIMRHIGRWYNVNVIFNNEACMQYKMHYFCNREEGIEHAIAQLNQMRKVTVKLKNNSIYIQ